MSCHVLPVSKPILLDSIEERLLFPAGPSSLCLGTPEREPTAVDLLVAMPSPMITDFCARREALRAQLDVGTVSAAKTQVENEWQSLVALKQEVAVTVLSLHLGKQAAQTKVETALETEKLLQHELIRLRLKNIKLRANIHRLEGELCAREKDAGDPLLLHFDLLQAERLELKKHTEKQNEESLKTQLKISSSLELLSNIKEKLFWSQMEAQAKREQLAMLEATVARGTDFLTRTRHARNSLRRDNLRLREHRGLLGNRVLLLDFEDTVDASDYLEDQLRDLKCRQAEIVFSCGRWKKKLRQPN